MYQVLVWQGSHESTNFYVTGMSDMCLCNANIMTAEQANAALPTMSCSEVGRVARTNTTEGQALWQPGGAEAGNHFREGDRHLRLAYDEEEEVTGIT